jgi:hypothetical protein
VSKEILAVGEKGRKEGKESAGVFFTRVNKIGTKSGLNL